MEPVSPRSTKHVIVCLGLIALSVALFVGITHLIGGYDNGGLLETLMYMLAVLPGGLGLWMLLIPARRHDLDSD